MITGFLAMIATLSMVGGMVLLINDDANEHLRTTRRGFGIIVMLIALIAAFLAGAVL